MLQLLHRRLRVFSHCQVLQPIMGNPRHHTPPLFWTINFSNSVFIRTLHAHLIVGVSDKKFWFFFMYNIFCVGVLEHPFTFDTLPQLLYTCFHFPKK